MKTWRTLVVAIDTFGLRLTLAGLLGWLVVGALLATGQWPLLQSPVQWAVIAALAVGVVALAKN